MKKAISGSAIAVLVAALSPLALPLFDKWTAHRERLEALRLSAVQHELIRECRDGGGKWWRGDCIAVSKEEEE